MTETSLQNDIRHLAWEAANALSQVKGKDIILLDVTEVAMFADYFVVATGESRVQMRALADRVRETMAKYGKKIGHEEGRRSHSWILLDYENLIVHILSKRARAYYALEQVWGDARVIPWTENGETASPLTPTLESNSKNEISRAI